MKEPYEIVERDDLFCFKTVLFRQGEGSALNTLVYNRELAAILTSGLMTTGLYVSAAHWIGFGWTRWVVLPFVFLGVYGVSRQWLFREHATETSLDRASGTITVRSERFFRRSVVNKLQMVDVRLLEMEEQPPPDESDIEEIVKWHKMAEPGVHSTPLPLYKLSLVRTDGRKILIYTDFLLERTQNVRQKLATVLGLL